MRFYLGDRLFLILELPEGFRRLGGCLANLLTSSLFFPVHWGRRDSSRALPFAAVRPLWQEVIGSRHRFTRSRGRGCLPSWEPDGDRLSQLAGFPVFKVSCSPLFSRFTSRQRGASAVASLSPAKEPFPIASSPFPLRIGFHRSFFHF